MKTKNKWIIAINALAILILLVTVSIVAVWAATNQSVKNTFTIEYTLPENVKVKTRSYLELPTGHKLLPYVTDYSSMSSESLGTKVTDAETYLQLGAYEPVRSALILRYPDGTSVVDVPYIIWYTEFVNEKRDTDNAFSVAEK